MHARRFCRSKRPGLVFLLFLIAIGCCGAAEENPWADVRPPLGSAKLAPSLRALAEREKLPLTRTVDSTDSRPLAGDGIVAWIGYGDGARVEQWLLRLRRAIPTKQESSRSGKEVKRYLSWGPVETYASNNEVLDLWLAGPVEEAADAAGAADKVPVHTARVPVAADFLRLGLDTEVLLQRKIAHAMEAHPKIRSWHMYSLGEPITQKAIDEAKPIVALLGLTPEEERLWPGSFVALEAFYHLGMDTPGLRDICEQVVAKPTLWKLMKLATGTHFTTRFGGGGEINPAGTGLLQVSTPAFQCPVTFSFDKEEMVYLEMVVTSPRPPLDTSAGIIGMIAVHPKEHKRVVQMILIGTERGTPRAP